MSTVRFEKGFRLRQFFNVRVMWWSALRTSRYLYRYPVGHTYVFVHVRVFIIVLAFRNLASHI